MSIFDNDNNSDYKKTRTRLDKLLPVVNSNDLNTSLFENLFNRYLTKDENVRVQGSVGDITAADRIPEEEVLRNAYQLQPVIHSKIGTVDHLMSWSDMKNELIRLGIDINTLNDFGSAKKFNWVPPIDIDKLIHYGNYYWNDANSTPQYITIKGNCQSINAYLNHFEKLIDVYGITFPIVGIDVANNAIVFSGDMTSMMENGFVFYTKNSTNADINNSFLTVVSSSYDSVSNKTSVIVNIDITDPSVSGIGSLEEQYIVILGAKQCRCEGSVGADILAFDDFPLLWWLSGVVSSLTSPLSPVVDDLWYDLNNGSLKKWDGLSWVVLYNNYTFLISFLSGIDTFDSGDGCSIFSKVPSAEQWIVQNKWVHKNDIINFSLAKKAEMPIIEFLPNLELNEWTKVQHNWKYRVNNTKLFEEVNEEPSLFELLPIELYNVSGNTIEINEKYGDLTGYFKAGVKFLSYSSVVIYEVVSSRFQSSLGQPYKTIIEVVSSIGLSGSLYPFLTSKGDVWKGYNEHWLYNGSNNIPINHQVENPFLDIDVSISYSETGYSYYLGKYSQQVNITSSGVVNIDLDNSLINKSLAEYDDIRVYVNGVRQYGNYEETISNFIEVVNYGSGLFPTANVSKDRVTGITFNLPLNAADIVLIEVGEASFFDFGLTDVPVRTIENDASFISTSGTVSVSLTKFKKYEQVKSEINQYPLFDLYFMNGEPAMKVSPIFTFLEDQNVDVNGRVGKRIVYDSITKDYGFEQHLITEDNGSMYAYKDYDKHTNDIYFNTITKQLWFWDGLCWSNVKDSGGIILEGYIADLEPGSFNYNIAIFYWFDTQNKELKLGSYNSLLNDWTWTVVSDITIGDTDPDILSIWKAGLNNEFYIPQYIDKNRQPLTIGDVNGDWEIPEQLRFNSSHENKKIVYLSEVFSHFNSIIENQIDIPSYSGSKQNQWHLIDYDKINYGLGGSIKEFNDGFDTLISSTFNDNITPLSIIEFAQDQYDASLNNIKDIFVNRLESFLKDISYTTSLTGLETIIDDVISDYEENDFLNLVFGDSGTFDDITNVGIRNFIETTAFINVDKPKEPYLNYDIKRNINEIIHHDGHRASYSLNSILKEGTILRVINSIDTRFNSVLGKKHGVLLPPDTRTLYENATYFNHTIANGVYWYYIPTNGRRTLYRLSCIVSAVAPIVANFPEGTLWYDTTNNVLKVLNSLVWNIVPGNINGDGKLHNGTNVQDATLSAWEDVNIDYLINNIILEVENRLYDRVVDKNNNLYDFVFDFSTLTNTLTRTATYNAYLEDAFLDFVRESDEYDDPYSSDEIYVATDAFTWNYKYFLPASITPSGQPYVSGGYWKDVYTKYFNTPYPHLEPWKLQGYENKPNWWDTEYKDTSGNRRWIYNHATTTGMWENIRIGVIPAGREYPNGIISITGNPSLDNVTLDVPLLPNYNYFCVNIDDNAIVVGSNTYEPDDIYPPYSPLGVVVSSSNRTIFLTPGDIISSGANYIFGDIGYAEYQWRTSSQFLFDKLKVAFRMEPMRLLNSVFGTEFYNVGGLQIDRRTDNTFSHTRTRFHGELNGNVVYQVSGINQWYINFNRYNGFDTTYSDFHSLWTEWSAPLSYQFGAMIDKENIKISNKYIDITPTDYKIHMKKSPGVEDYWVTSFKVTVINTPPSIIRFNNEHLWHFNIDVPTTIATDIQVYGTKHYQFYVDTTTDTCTLYTYPIINVTTSAKLFSIEGDWTDVFVDTGTFYITGSTGNNGNYTIVTSFYDAINNRTIIETLEPIPNPIIDGLITANYRTLPWETGDAIWFSTNDFMPSPLKDNLQYFIIKVSSNSFKVAYRPSDASSNIPMDLTTAGSVYQYVGEINTTFKAIQGDHVPNIWRQYAVDKRYILTYRPTFTLKGIQKIINFVVGYSIYIEDQGFIINNNKLFTDPLTNRVIDWQVELERLLDYIFRLRIQRTKIDDRFEAEVDDATDVWTFIAELPQFRTGDRVRVFTSGVYPAPILHGADVYMIRLTDTTFKLAATNRDAINGNAIDVLFTPSLGRLYITTAKRFEKYPSFELNAFRNAIWYKPQKGIVSDVVIGPVVDIRMNQLIFDQYGRRLLQDDLRVFRQDKVTQILCADEILNDVEGFKFIITDPYNWIHLGGAHLFIDTYEHMLLFNNYTIQDCLIYDPFFGLNIAKFNLLFDKIPDFTLRPNMGGSYLVKNYDNGTEEFNGQLVRNIEASVDDMRYFYDSYKISENRLTTRHSRANLDYYNTMEFLNDLEVNNKTQFLFYKGMLQYKGSINAITAFTNSRHLVEAELDEFWALKVADFGSVKGKSFPELFLTTKDTITNDVRFEFIENETNLPDNGFTGVSVFNTERWTNQPDQLRTFSDKGNIVFFEGKISNEWNVPVSIQGTQNGTGTDIIFNTPLEAINTYVFINGIKQILSLSYTIIGINTIQFITAPIATDVIEFVSKSISGYETITSTGSLVENVSFTLTPNSVLEVFVNGIKQISDGSSYVVTLPSIITFNSINTGDVIEFYLIDTNIIDSNVSYFNGNGTLTTFNIPTLETNDTTNVYINGIKQLNTLSYSQNVGSVILSSPPLSTDRIEIYDYYDITIAEETTNTNENTFASVLNDNTILRHNFASDIVVIKVERWRPGLQYIVKPSDITGNVITIPEYIPNSDNITIMQNGIILKNGIDYFESDVSLVTISSTTIEMVELPILTPLTIIYNTATLKENVHYERINSNIVRVFADDILFNVFSMKLYGIIPERKYHNAAKLNDVVSNTTTATLEIYDPARGYYYSNANHIIDIKSDDDPAYYSTTNIIKQPANVSPTFSNGDNRWDNNEAGKVWWDTTLLDYIPYHDDKIYPSIDKRIENWGTLADWSEIKLYEWTKSPVLPEDYDIYAQTASIDNTLDITERNSGTAKRTIVRLNADETTSIVKPVVDEFDVIIEGVPVISDTYEFSLINIVPETFDIVAMNQEFETFQISEDGVDLSHLFGNDIQVELINSTGGVNDGLWAIGTASFDEEVNGTLLDVKRVVPEVLVDYSSEPYTITTPSTITLNPLSGDMTLIFVSDFRFTIGTTEYTVDTTSFTGQTIITVSEILTGTETGDITSTEIIHIPLELGSIRVYQPVNVYVNGITKQEGFRPVNEIVEFSGLSEKDRVTFIQPIPAESFILSEVSAQRMTYDYDYTTIEVANHNTGTSVFEYYFWVENKTLSNKLLSLLQTEQQLSKTPNAHMFFQKPFVPSKTIINNEVFNLPYRYSQVIIKGLRGMVDDNRRFAITFTQDYTLRDHLYSMEYKNSHTEWEMFRQGQNYHIKRELWDNITEAIIGHKLNDDTFVIPANNRVIYDELYDTDTQYGLNEDQAFVNGQIALNTILNDLNSPENNFYPKDINSFFETYNFDTSENIIEAMNAIYTSFKYEDVNRIFFGVLHDALVGKKVSRELMKTSYIALKGVRQFNVNGVLD